MAQSVRPDMSASSPSGCPMTWWIVVTYSRRPKPPLADEV
jgi:hypothetical protein